MECSRFVVLLFETGGVRVLQTDEDDIRGVGAFLHQPGSHSSASQTFIDAARVSESEKGVKTHRFVSGMCDIDAY